MNTFYHKSEISPGPQLLRTVLAGLHLKGTTLVAWCEVHGIARQNARAALLGKWNGPKGRRVRRQLVEASDAEALLKRP